MLLQQRHPGLAAQRQPQHVAVPVQVGLPGVARPFSQRLPSVLAEQRLEPAPGCKRGDAEVWPRQVLGRAQGPHAGVGDPRPFTAARCGIQHQDVGDALADQSEGDRKPALAAPDDHDVMDMLAGRIGAWQHPWILRIDHDLEVVLNAPVESLQPFTGVRPQWRQVRGKQTRPVLQVIDDGRKIHADVLLGGQKEVTAQNSYDAFVT